MKILLEKFSPFLLKLKYLFSKNKNGIVPLIFHNILPDEFNDCYELLSYLKKYYCFLTPAELEILQINNKPIDHKYLLLTFDDGFFSNKIVADQILKSLNIKAIFFVCVDFINCQTQYENFVQNQLLVKITPQLSSLFKPMCWEDLYYLKSEGHVIGSHTFSHQSLANLPAFAMRHEIIHSGDYLAAKIESPINYFAFPFGDIKNFNRAAWQIAASRYALIFSGIRGFNYNFYSKILYRQSIQLKRTQKFNHFIIENGLNWKYHGARKCLQSIIKV